jgi:predicted nucleic acid-binding protein
VARLLRTGEVATSRLSEVEVASALVRCTREGGIASADGERAIARLSDDLAAVHVVELIPEVTARARSLLRQHPLRAADAVQLASCLFLGDELAEAVPFVAFDARLRAAARAERLNVLPLRLAVGRARRSGR